MFREKILLNKRRSFFVNDHGTCEYLFLQWLFKAKLLIMKIIFVYFTFKFYSMFVFCVTIDRWLHHTQNCVYIYVQYIVFTTVILCMSATNQSFVIRSCSRQTKPITAHNIGHNFNAPLPTDEIMRVFSSVILDAISNGTLIAGIVCINSAINQIWKHFNLGVKRCVSEAMHQICVQASVEPIFSSGNAPNRRGVSINADRKMAVTVSNCFI